MDQNATDLPAASAETDDRGLRHAREGATAADTHTERFVVIGSSEAGASITLQALDDASQWTDALAYWRIKSNSYPFHCDVHVAREVKTVTYRRMDDFAHEAL